jgi:hypothetical protein
MQQTRWSQRRVAARLCCSFASGSCTTTAVAQWQRPQDRSPWKTASRQVTHIRHGQPTVANPSATHELEATVTVAEQPQASHVHGDPNTPCRFEIWTPSFADYRWLTVRKMQSSTAQLPHWQHSHNRQNTRFQQAEHTQGASRSDRSAKQSERPMQAATHRQPWK